MPHCFLVVVEDIAVACNWAFKVASAAPETFSYFRARGEGVELGPMFPYNTSITFLVFGFTMIQGTTSRHLRRTFGMLVGATLETWSDTCRHLCLQTWQVICTEQLWIFSFMKSFTICLLLVCVHTKLMHCLAGEDFFFGFRLGVLLSENFAAEWVLRGDWGGCLGVFSMNFSILKRL